MLYSGRYIKPNGPIRSYDVSPDGQWFVRVRPKGNDQPPRQIEIVLNWTEELKRLVPVK